MKTVQTEVPEQLYAQLRSLVALGWFQDEGDVLREALRRFLEVHRPDIMDEFVRKDVEWDCVDALTHLSSSVTWDR